jgi:hypothetical protein
MNTPPADAGGFGLRPGTGAVDHSAEGGPSDVCHQIPFQPPPFDVAATPTAWPVTPPQAGILLQTRGSPRKIPVFAGIFIGRLKSGDLQAPYPCLRRRHTASASCAEPKSGIVEKPFCNTRSKNQYIA